MNTDTVDDKNLLHYLKDSNVWEFMFFPYCGGIYRIYIINRIVRATVSCYKEIYHNSP